MALHQKTALDAGLASVDGIAPGFFLGWQAYLDGGKILRGRNLADGKEKGLDNGF
jgi:hypothetical protein